ncbi:P-loop NTPase family protein [Paenibacillus xanthanilyticus]|uniref:AAA domain-containing protein n=1 Tax=Paenibacillus xanthanilyticus TaxID=1783531 RepID=A0ABV8K8I1_9BACL
MHKQQLVAAVREADYLERLADYIRHSAFGERWQLTAFTNPQALRQYLKSGYPVDLLVAQTAFTPQIEEAGVSCITGLFVPIGHTSGEREIAQFQPLPTLLQSFETLYASGAPGGRGSIRGTKKSAVVTVCSAVSGIGKTTLALRLAQAMGARGNSAFYLNLEQWNASASWLGREGREDALSRLLYTLQSEPEQAAGHLNELKCRHAGLKIDYIPPCPNPEERESMTAELAELLIRAIRESGYYDLLVIDTDGRFDPVTIRAMQASDTLLWMTEPYASSRIKTEMAWAHIKARWGEGAAELARRTKWIAVHPGGTNDEPYAETRVRIDHVLPPAEEGGHGAEPSASPGYRAAIEHILERQLLRARGR